MIFAMHERMRTYVYASAVIIALWLFTFTIAPPFAHAGFGITPPYVRNDRLTRGSVFEQKIIMVRQDPVEDLKGEVTINVPGINEWFTIDLGKEFILPKGKKQVAMSVRVRVPSDAEFASYKGAIRIRTSPVDMAAVEGVSIALGAQVDVDIEVVDKIFDFVVRKVAMSDVEAWHKRWSLRYPGKIRFLMTLENTGNAPFAPTRVTLDIYDHRGETLLESIENKNKIKNIDPFAIEEVVAEFPTFLNAGRYTAKYSIYKFDEVVQSGEVNLSIVPYGSIPGYEGYGFAGLLFADKAKVISLPVSLISLIAFLFIARRRRASIGRRRKRA